MQYMVLIYLDETEADSTSYSKMSPEYEAYTAQLAEAGVVRSGSRLQRSSTATTVRIRDEEELFTDGPFAEAREQLGGFYIFECANLDEALKWAAQCPSARSGAVEVRPLAY
jgi:hypothetical protein